MTIRRQPLWNLATLPRAMAVLAVSVLWGVSAATAGTTYENYTFTTLAGLPEAGRGWYDGLTNAARFHFPAGVGTDRGGNIYLADLSNHTIRKLSPSGVVTTLAGLAGVSGTNNGAGSAARFNQPQSVAVDTSGNVYVADTFNHTIRKVTPNGVTAGVPAQFYSIRAP